MIAAANPALQWLRQKSFLNQTYRRNRRKRRTNKPFVDTPRKQQPSAAFVNKFIKHFQLFGIEKFLLYVAKNNCFVVEQRLAIAWKAIA